jgi:hypothetical protein
MTEPVNDQDERRALIAQLFGAFGKTPSESQYSGYEAALKLMTTPRLARVVATWLEGIAEATDPQDLRVPTAGRLWELARKLRRLPEPPRGLELKAEEPKLLPFDTNANQLLLAYVWDAMRAGRADRYAPDPMIAAEPAPRTRERTAILVRWKNLWAAQMRAGVERGEKPDGKALWAEHMACAEYEIARLITIEPAAT